MNLNISHNSISDVSVLITESIFPNNFLTTLDISDNNICDIEGMVDELETYFSTGISITYSDQTCHCSASVSSSDHQVCREVYPDRWAVECWNGYYLDKSTGTCVEATDSSDIIRCQVCERHSNMKPVLEVGATSITCGCRSAWYGDDCEELYQVYIPDEMFRAKVCKASEYSISIDPLCDVSEFDMAEIDPGFSPENHNITTLQGAQNIINISSLDGQNTDVISVSSLSNLSQISYISLPQYSNDFNTNINDLNSLVFLHRLYQLCIAGNEQIYDISILFRNISMNWMEISNTYYGSDPIPLCRSENDAEYWAYINEIFEIHESGLSSRNFYFIQNGCPLNSDNNQSCDPSSFPAKCPSIVLNEVYNSVADPAVKECAFIAKSSDGKCYTVHDDYIRQYLIANCLPGGTNDLDSGIISVATMRSVLSCHSATLSLSSIASYLDISVNSMTTLQGLEYASSLTYLNIDGYDLSGDINSNAEYDKLVVQILAKAVTSGTIDSGLTSLSASGCGLSAININSNAEYDKLVVQILAKAVTSGTIDSGLTSLSASGCGLSAISDVLDLTPIASGDSTTDQFKLTSLDLSNNSISDVSVLITSYLFTIDTLVSLNISGNSICDIDNVVTTFQSYFTNSNFYVAGSDQSTCPCSEGVDVSFSSHKTCRQRSDGTYQVECWNGYYLDKETNSCVESVTSEDSIRCQVCERKAILVPIIDIGASDVSCGCTYGFHGDSCEYVDIPDSNLRSALCLAVTNPSAHDSSCDDLTIADMDTVTSVSASTVDSFEGLQHAVNLTSLSISGTSSSSVSIGNTDLAYLPLSLTDLTLEAVYLDADSDLSSFTALTTLSLNDNTDYDITESGLFPSPSSLTSFSANNTSISLLFHLVASMPNLTDLSLNNNNISDPSPLYALSSSGSWSSIDLSYNHICGGDNGDSAIETFLASKFSLSTADVNASGQACICSSDDLGSTPLDVNKVCAETKPGSNTWYVVCASDSYTSYTSAEDFTCMQTTSPTTNCSGGCEYGYECRYLGDEVIDGVTYSTGECQRVIVDGNLHDYVADLFNDYDGTANYIHRTADTPSLFSVASLKTLVSVAINNQYYPQIQYNDSSLPIDDLSGIEHLGGIKLIGFSSVFSADSDDIHLDLLSTLTNLVQLNLSRNSSLSYLPNITSLTSLEVLGILKTSIILPSEEYILPTSLKSFYCNFSNVNNEGFAKNVGDGYLPDIEQLVIGGDNNLLTSIDSLTTSQKENMKNFSWRSSPIDTFENYPDILAEMPNLESLSLFDCNLQTIPDLSIQAETLTILNISLNPLLASLTPIVSSDLTNLTYLYASGCAISDPSPLFALSSNTWSYIYLANNYICGDDLQTIFEDIFSSSPDLNINVSNQTCGCSDSNP
ncbi:hypothetical protein ADUPG1_012828, partial [Aduncisulcus paluster]